jgi:hypothetical protein
MHRALGNVPGPGCCRGMIAATAIAGGLPLLTTSPGDYAGLEKLIRIVPVTRPPLPHQKTLRPRLSAVGIGMGGGAVSRR